MTIFIEVKEYLTTRQVAESYGLQVKRNGLACCPFHNDKHPSMKIDENYHCFACGVGGDAIDYVSRMFGLSQYDAALKLIEDFTLPIDAKGNAELSVQEKEVHYTYSKSVKIRLWAKSIPNLNEESCKKHFDELEVSELKGIFTKRNTRTKSYVKDDYVTDVLEALKRNDWIYDYYESKKDSGRYIVIKNRPKKKTP